MATELTVEIDPELRRRAEMAAAQKGYTLADVVRSALEELVEESEHAEPSESQLLIEVDPIFQMAGKFSGSSDNIAERADEIIEADIDPVRGLGGQRGGTH